VDALNRIKLDQGPHGGRTNRVDTQIGWTHKLGGRTKWVDAQIGFTHNRNRIKLDQPRPKTLHTYRQTHRHRALYK